MTCYHVNTYRDGRVPAGPGDCYPTATEALTAAEHRRTEARDAGPATALVDLTSPFKPADQDYGFSAWSGVLFEVYAGPPGCREQGEKGG